MNIISINDSFVSKLENTFELNLINDKWVDRENEYENFVATKVEELKNLYAEFSSNSIYSPNIKSISYDSYQKEINTFGLIECINEYDIIYEKTSTNENIVCEESYFKIVNILFPQYNTNLRNDDIIILNKLYEKYKL